MSTINPKTGEMWPYRICASVIPCEHGLLQAKMTLHFDDLIPYVVCVGFMSDKDGGDRQPLGSVKLSVRSIRQAFESLNHEKTQELFLYHAKMPDRGE